MPEVGHNSSSRERKDGAVMFYFKRWKWLDWVLFILFILSCVCLNVWGNYAVKSYIDHALIIMPIVFFFAGLWRVLGYWGDAKIEMIRREENQKAVKAKEFVDKLRNIKKQRLPQAIESLKQLGIYFDEAKQTIIVPDQFWAVGEMQSLGWLADSVVTVCRSKMLSENSDEVRRVCAQAVQELMLGRFLSRRALLFAAVIKREYSLLWPEDHPLA